MKSSDIPPDKLTPAEEDAFRALRNMNGAYSTRTEDLVVNALQKRGLIRRTRRSFHFRLIQLSGLAAVMILVFFAGMRYGRETATEPVPTIQKIQHDPDTVPTHRFDAAPREYVADLNPTLQDYRDEPDRPGNGNRPFSKYRLD